MAHLYDVLEIKNQQNISFCNVTLEKDTRLFIDPTNILQNNDPLSIEARWIIQRFFTLLISHIKAGREKDAMYLLSGLNESGTTSSLIHLGYSSSNIGKAIWQDKAIMIYNALAKSTVIQSWLSWIEDAALLIEGIDKDNISDLIANLIGELLIRYSLEAYNPYNNKTTHTRILLWNHIDMKWNYWTREIPQIKWDAIIFVPKNLVWKNNRESVQGFFTKIVIPHEQENYLRAGSALCRLLKDWTKGKPFIKDLRKEIPCTKQNGISYIETNPSMLLSYKRTI